MSVYGADLDDSSFYEFCSLSFEQKKTQEVGVAEGRIMSLDDLSLVQLRKNPSFEKGYKPLSG